MASLSYLHPYLSYTQAKAIQLDVPSPVVDALLALLQGACHYTAPQLRT
jgi:ubiquitin carboxyl-terminal hydrolase 1